jgi:hypothetical protein
MKYALALVIYIFAIPAAVFAHGVEVFDETGNPGVRTVRFGYTDGEPMLFARVKVFSPSSPGAPVQESVADRAGYFSFIPFEPGAWQLTAEDGMGHKGTITLVVDADAGDAGNVAGTAGAAGAGSGTRPPLVYNIALGLSLLFNAFGVWRLAGSLGRRWKKAGVNHAH